MRKGFRIAWLFAAYGAIAFGGQQAFGQLLQAAPGWAPRSGAQDGRAVVVRTVANVEPEKGVRVHPAIVTRVRVRHDAECTFESEREMALPASVDGTLSVRSGSGELHVEGREGLDEVVVVGLLCASHEEYLDGLAVRAEQTADGDILVDTHYPEQRRWSGSGQNVARIDLTVLVPRGMAVRIDDSSGDLVVSGTGDLWIDDSSGSLEVFDIDGDVEVQDGSGSVEISDVTGDVRVSDGSGGIDVRGVSGDFVVARDGSGGIRHSGVEGRVDVPEKKRRRRR